MEVLEHINKEVYKNLEHILQKLDDRLDLKLYAITLDKDHNWIKAIRVKSGLSDLQGQESEIIQEELNDPAEVLKKLGLPQEDPDIDLKQFLIHLDTNSYKPVLHPIEVLTESAVSEDQEQIETHKKHVPRLGLNEWNVLYSNSFGLKIRNKNFTVKYILSVEYTDSVTRSVFLERPQLSLLRMILDYYFTDYYKTSGNQEFLFISDDIEIETKYKENCSQFLQRIARLFFGKVQDLLINKYDLDYTSSVGELTEIEKNQYYNNNLLEKIDGISNRTYEGESPFGCMLLLNTNMLNNSKLVKYSIRFQDQQPINLEDARRIRKLLELTNNERDLYLIADDMAIYGVGEIDWSHLGGDLLFKVEFKGLSQYDLLLVTTEKMENTDAQVVAGVESKIFRMTTNLEIVSRKLTSISFKQPGRGGVTPELFERTLKSQFKESVYNITDKEIERLRLIIQKATEQKGGTMVVITDPATAISEMKKLRKQSTPIQPTEISPAFIKHLTSIDGAIYFDTTGACHAIGVILDGLAQDYLGDASRGARFHSAHRYLEKLKLENKGCVIAIISEDGMINLIPEQANEAVVRKLVKTMMSYIKDNDELSEEMLQDYDSRLKEVENETTIDHHHYFKVAETFFNKNHFLKAAQYYEKGLEVCGRFILKYNRALAYSIFKQSNSTEITKEGKLKLYEAALKQIEIIFKMADDSELNQHDYNRRAISLQFIGRYSDLEKKKEYYNKSLLDLTKAMEIMKGSKYVLYRNRGYLNQEMGNSYEALDDYISSEIEYSEELTLQLIKKLIKKEVPLYLQALAIYSAKKNDKYNSEALEKLLEDYGNGLKEENPEVAAALEEYSFNQDQQDEE